LFSINVDLSEIAELLDLKQGLKSASDAAARDLAAMTHAKATELAGERLHSRREMFVEALKYHQVEDGVWLVSLEARARWIDDGQPEHSQLDALLASPKAKRAKDGSKYLVIPFDHSPGQGKTTTTAVEQDLINVIKSEMKRRGIPFGKIETDASGAAKIGKLHSFDITNLPIKNADGPGMGHGPKGDVRQGPTGTPFLQGVSVYQGAGKSGKVKRSIMTFRIASSKHKGQGRWDHPGNAGTNILDDAAKWAAETFEKEMAPGILAKVLIDLAK
jgi:hypothetical protein